MAFSFLHDRANTRASLKVLFVILIGVNLACAFQVIRLSSAEARMKRDYASVNSVRFGLFSMETWKTHFEKIVSKSILNLDLSPRDEAILKAEIEKVVRIMITQADKILTRDQKTLGKKVRKVAYQALVDVPQLVDNSPKFAQAVMKEITKPESLAQLRNLALNQLNRYAGETRNNDADGLSLAQVLARYNVTSIEEFNTLVPPNIHSLHGKIRVRILFLMGTVFLVLYLWWLLRNESHLHKPLFRYSALIAVIVLVTSLSIPMLDVDARIKAIDLMLLGEPIQFTNQVLYYRSKSILEVVHTLVMSRKGDALFVGFLLVLFSVIFPLAKLAAALLVLSGKERTQHNKWLNFFAFKSGKWSMADVMVVAIFMAFIGFNSILNDQLKGLNVSAESWQMITTNETSLQPGFVLFVTFVLFGLALSEILKRILMRERVYMAGGEQIFYREESTFFHRS